jgi:lipoprotein signal peptidase
MRKWLLTAAIIVVIDQIAKYVIVQKFVLHETLWVTSFFNLVRVHNTGAAFSGLGVGGVAAAAISAANAVLPRVGDDTRRGHRKPG